jgi:hypothetical protein
MVFVGNLWPGIFRNLMNVFDVSYNQLTGPVDSVFDYYGPDSALINNNLF